MKRWVAIFAVLVLFVVVRAALVPLKILSPGATGMNSNFDIQELKITDARYLENARIDENLGAVERRRGINEIGDNNAVVFTATGFFTDLSETEDVFDYRQIVGVTHGINTIEVTDPDDVTPDTTLTYTFASADTSVFNYAVSNQNASGIDDSTISTGGFASRRNVDVAYLFGRPVFADGVTSPRIYQDRTLVVANSTHSPDSTDFDPWMMSLGLEAPGQLRVGVVHETAPPKGAYRYNLCYGSTTTNAGIPSNWVFPDSQKVLISLFQARPKDRSIEDSAITIAAELWKQKIGQPWYALDTVNFWGGESVHYLDTFSDNKHSDLYASQTIRAASDFNFEAVMSNAINRRPGSIRIPNLLADSVSYDQSTAQEAGLGEDSLSVFVDSFYFFAYSYYDPFLDIESPIGPVSYGRLNSNDCVDCSGGTDTLLVRGAIGTTVEYDRPLWIRFYRSVVSDTLMLREALKLYGLFQTRARMIYPKDSTALQSIILGHISDDSLTGGSQYWVNCSDCDYRDFDILQDEDGGALVRPPFISGIGIPFSDIEFKSGRLWGIGDPLFKHRLYYSAFDKPYDINATQFLQLDEDGNAEIVAIEKIALGEESVLYALKHNSIYLITGYDPEFDLTFSLLSGNIGALSKKAIVNTGDEIFFMAPNMKIYSLSGGSPPKEISQPIENYIDTLFTDFITASAALVAFRMQDKVVWSDTANSRTLVFNISTRSWAIDSYDAGVRLIGSFRYDSLNAPAYDEFDYWMYQSDASEAFRVEYNRTNRDSLTAGFFIYPTVYQTPQIGDGSGLYAIQSVQIVADWDVNDTLIVYIVNKEGTLTDSVRILSDGRADGLYQIGFAPNLDSYPSLRFKSGEDVDTMIIHSVVVNYRKVVNSVVLQ